MLNVTYYNIFSHFVFTER